MDILDLRNLEQFEKVDSDRQARALKKVENYCFKDSFDLMAELVEDPYLFRLVIDEKDNLYVNFLARECVSLYSYYVNAFTVYTDSIQSSRYFAKNEELTKKWRNIMRSAYPDSNFVEDAKKFLNRERQERIDLINDDIDKQINNL